MADTLNSTVYETDDILAIVTAVGGYLSEKGTRGEPLRPPKIRYMNHAKRLGRWNDPDAKESFSNVMNNWHGGTSDICLVRPSKVEINALVALAEAADAKDDHYYAPRKVAADVIGALYDVMVDPCRIVRAAPYGQREKMRAEHREKALKDIQSLGLGIRLNPKAKGRKAYTLENLKKKLKGRKNNLTNQEHKLRVALRKVKALEKTVPVIEASITKMTADIAEREKELDE